MNKPMTASEIIERQKAAAKALADLQVKVLGPVIDRALAILKAHGVEVPKKDDKEGFISS